MFKRAIIVKKISRTWFRSWRFGKAKEAKKIPMAILASTGFLGWFNRFIYSFLFTDSFTN